MNLEYFDIHSHLNFPQFDGDRKQIIEEMKNKKIGTICVGTNLKTSKECVELANKNENIWATIGIHPADSREDFNEEEFSKLLKSSKIVGIGECGIDYFNTDDSEEEKNRQKKLFKKQIEFSIKHNLPLMIHCRDAYEDVLEMLEKYKGRIRGNVHFFSSTKEVAKKFMEINFMFSFTAVLTLTNDYDEILRAIPMDKIMSETDSPFVAPKSNRGKRNNPIFVIDVVEKIADIKKENLEFVKKQMVKNAVAMWGIL